MILAPEPHAETPTVACARGSGGPSRPGEAFRALLRERARGPASLGPLDPDLCERAMEMILSGEATPAQAAAFLLVGRAAGDSAAEVAAYARALRRRLRPLPAQPGTVAVAGGFDGKVRTLNFGAAASLVAAASGARVVHLCGEGVPPKEGRTVFDALRNLGAEAPQSLDAARDSLLRHGLAAVSPRAYLPELYALTPLRWEMARRTVLNVVEKLAPPVPEAPLLVGVTHASSLATVPETLRLLGAPFALVYAAVEGSDEAPLDGTSPLVLVRDGEARRTTIEPRSLGLGKATRSDVPWAGEKDEARRVRAALGGEAGPVLDLILYNAALQLWASGRGELRDAVRRARETVESGEALRFLGSLTA